MTGPHCDSVEDMGFIRRVYRVARYGPDKEKRSLVITSLGMILHWRLWVDFTAFLTIYLSGGYLLASLNSPEVGDGYLLGLAAGYLIKVVLDKNEYGWGENQ